jgi:hypothetical protein
VGVLQRALWQLRMLQHVPSQAGTVRIDLILWCRRRPPALFPARVPDHDFLGY